MLIKMECPHCGASLDFDNSKEFMFCSYCGTKIANIEETININHSGEVVFKRDKSDDPNLIISYATIKPLVCMSTLIKTTNEQWIYSQNQSKSYRLAPGRHIIVFSIGRHRWSKAIFIPNDNTPVVIQVIFNRDVKINIQQPPQGIQDFNSAQAIARDQALAQPKRVRKSIFKRWWFWVFIAPAAIMVAFIFLGTFLSVLNPSGTQSTTSITILSSSQESVKTAQEIRDDYINGCTTIDYATLARNPDKYKGQHFKFTGQVIQVLESTSLFNDSTTLRVNVTPQEKSYDPGNYSWSDTIICTVTIPKGEDRILEDDIIDLYGECYGLYTYTAVLGNEISIPRIDIEYYTIHE